MDPTTPASQKDCCQIETSVQETTIRLQPCFLGVWWISSASGRNPWTQV